MQAKELKLYLLDDTDRIFSLLESFGFHDMWLGSEEIRCATPTGSNKTAVAIKLVEELYAVSFDDEFNYRGDLLGLLQEASDTTFSNVMIRIHNLFNLPHTNTKEKKRIDLLKDVRRFKKGRKKDIEVKKYDKSILEQFVDKPHASMIEECISPSVLKQYNILFDPIRDRIVFPHFDCDEPDKIVGIQGRTTLPSELAKELNVPKYWNFIKGFKKAINLYGWHLAKDNIEEHKMLIIFEGEKSVLKHSTIEFGKGFSVALGGHELSEFQKNFIIKNTSEDVEIVIAFDKDIMRNQEKTELKNAENGTDDLGELELICQMFSKFRKTSYIYDKYGVLDDKDSPIDKGYAKFMHLLKWRVKV